MFCEITEHFNFCLLAKALLWYLQTTHSKYLPDGRQTIHSCSPRCWNCLGLSV